MDFGKDTLQPTTTTAGSLGRSARAACLLCAGPGVDGPVCVPSGWLLEAGLWLPPEEPERPWAWLLGGERMTGPLGSRSRVWLPSENHVPKGGASPAWL